MAEGGDKDGWDKLAAISGLVSALLVAVIGGAATYLYNRRQRAAEATERDRELGTIEAQTVASFLPHLHSGDTKEKEAALVAMSALGNTALVTKLARIYQDEASVGALSQIASGVDQDDRLLAEESLEQILKKAVVKIDHKKGIQTGFCFTPQQVVTCEFQSEDEEPAQEASLTTSDGKTYKALFSGRDVARGLKVLQIQGGSLGTLRLLEPGIPTNELGDLAVLGWGGGRGWHYSSGNLEDGPSSIEEPASMVAALETEPGFAGAPVVDKLGRVIAMHYGSQPRVDGTRQAILIPVETIREGLEAMGYLPK